MNDTLLSIRVRRIEPSATVKVTGTAIKLKNQGRDIINLGAGEPDFDTPYPIKQSAIAAIRQGFTKYTQVGGTDVLKEVIIQKLKRDNHLDYEPNEIIVSNGAKQSIYNAVMAVLNARDEVIIPAPYWVSYPSIVKMAEAVPVIVKTTFLQNFKLTPQKLKKAITEKTRLIILNSPSNPSGAAYSRLELETLAKILLQHPKVFILSDDIYEYILWGQDYFTNIINVCPKLRDRTVVINGVSKAFAMTGWRIGYAAGPKIIIQAMEKIQSQSTSCPNTIAQAAAITALKYNRNDFNYMYKAYKMRHDLILNKLNEMKNVRCLSASGAFYLFPDMTEVIKRLGFLSDIEFSTYLLDKANIAVVPGSAFGFPGYIRLSCTASNAILRKAMNRLTTVLQ
ncbi:pyridoxal phosphate-dependent aminotransferase [Coxiella endosymbiont of Amblyomma americanum]|uniref:pyridoxal phosphate-dependent aminotransferase n=1 Tax=Coxiella endosymbiont of Amblyomma americanum TaxID=325775 RepID=UPI00057CD1BE|nr:pyridoxal phosphate-dependent aminotransferase [Coxiella endosymbiont of Amblyomma americanum]AJC50665.1 aspartate aminotransferase [Coxiella endosymbiont of Amblyomma americanum]